MTFSTIILAMTLTLGPVSETEESREAVRVSSDSLVCAMRKISGEKIYFLKDERDEAFYTVKASKAQFLGIALEELRSKGYSAQRHGDAWWIAKSGLLNFDALPTTYFDKGKTVSQESITESAATEVTFQNKIYEIGDRSSGKTTGSAVVRGYVRDAVSGEPLVGVSVFNDHTNSYALTDAEGYYRITLPLGDNILGFSGYSMEDLRLNVRVWDNGALDITMKEKVTALKAAVATADSRSAHRESLMGAEKVRIATIKKIPTAFGEADVLKVVLTLPGVKSVGEAASGFNVRGGATDQNLIIFNDATIFNPSHMFGIMSSFNADVINDIELYKGSIPAEFGGRLSSVLDIRGKEGNSNKVAGSLGIGMLTSNFTLEGPLRKGKSTFIIGGRTTYSDWLLNSLPRTSSYSGASAGFSDLNASVTRKFGERHSIQLCGYWSSDNFSFASDTTFRYSNLNLSVHWRSHLTERHSLSIAAGMDRFGSSLDDEGYDLQAYRMRTSIEQIYGKMTLKSIYGKSIISCGVQANSYKLMPGELNPLGELSKMVPQRLSTENGVETVAFISEKWTPGARFSTDLGCRYSAFFAGKTYATPEIRASLKWSMTPSFTFKASAGTMAQYIHMISNNTSVSPMDTWHLSSARVKPQTGWQASAGLYKTFSDSGTEFSVEAYRKGMEHYLDYRSGAVLTMNPELEDDLIETYGKAYGIEAMVRRTAGKLTGWVAYTYSRTFLREMHDRGVETINGGDWYKAACDKPHDVKLVANWKFTHRYSLSLNGDYSTGRPVTVPIGKYKFADSYILAYSQRNAYRVPDYFRMDVAFNFDPSHKIRQAFHTTVTAGVYNVTGRHNAYSVYYTVSSGLDVKGKMLCVFAQPIPYININVKF